MCVPRKIIDNQKVYDGRILLFESLASTNDWAMENINHLQHRDVVWAVCQTEGKGRFDRKWISPGDLNLTVSIIVKCSGAGERFISSITQLAAISVAAALRETSIPAMVKWPNDILVNGKKIAGILAERDSETGAIVLGIGININITSDDLENQSLRQPATSIKMETGRDHVVGEVLNTLLLNLDRRLDCASAKDFVFPLKEWDGLDFLKGKVVSVATEETRIDGSYSGMDKSGRLIVTDETGKRHEFWSGDVSVRAKT